MGPAALCEETLQCSDVIHKLWPRNLWPRNYFMPIHGFAYFLLQKKGIRPSLRRSGCRSPVQSGSATLYQECKCKC